MGLRNYLFLGFLVLCGIAVVGQLYVTIPLGPDIARRFGVAPGSAALAGSAFGIAFATGALIFGPLSDRFGRKRIILSGLVAMTIVTAIAGAVQGFYLLLLARAAQGLAAATFPPAALSLVAEQLPPSHRALAISLMSLAFLGAAPITQYFAAEVGVLPASMYLIAPIYLLVGLALYFFARADHLRLFTGRRSGCRKEDEKAGLRALLIRPEILAAWLAASSVLFGFVSFHAGAQALNGVLGGGHGIDLQMLRLVGLPPLLLTLVAAGITHRFSSLVTARLGLLVMAGAFLAATIGATAAVFAASILLSCGVALAVPGLIATIAVQASNDNRGLAIAIYTFILFLGASAAPPVVQMLAGLSSLALWLLPAVLLAGAALVLTLTPRRVAVASPG